MCPTDLINSRRKFFGNVSIYFLEQNDYRIDQLERVDQPSNAFHSRGTGSAYARFKQLLL